MIRSGSVGGKAHEQTRATCLSEAFLAASSRFMSGIPRGIAAAMAIMVPDCRIAGRGAGPIATSMVLGVSGKIGCPVCHRARQDVMPIGFVAPSIDESAGFVERRFLDDVLR